MPKPVITIDIDGVLFDTPAWAVSSFNEKHGTTHDIAELFDHNAVHDKSILATNTDHFHATQKQTELYQLMPGCQEALEVLSKDYDLIALTSRGYEEFQKITDELVRVHLGGYIGKVIYTTQPDQSAHKEKGLIAKELGSVMHIDDSVAYCLSCRQHGVLAILLTQPYNLRAAYDPDLRANSWDEIPALIKRHVMR